MTAPFRLERRSISIGNLLLDPNNPRFFDLDSWEKVPDNMYHLESVQNIAFQRLEGTTVGQIQDLRKSIKSNGYIPAEMIVVKPYVHDQTKYIIIEGNRRLAAIKGIIQNAPDPENDELVQSLRQLEVLVYESTGDTSQDQINEMILQGIRHIGGPKEWGAYQKANLVVQLRDDLEQDWTEIGQRMGLGPIVTARYYRAYKALKQMMQDEEFGEYAHPKLFSLFDEAIKRQSIKEWLSWSDEQMCFTNGLRLSTFYSLLVGSSDDQQPARITNPQHMRQFGEIIMSDKQTVISRFLEGEIGIDQALRLVKPDPINIPLIDSLEVFLDSLSNFPAEELRNLSQEELDLFDKIVRKLNYLRSLHQAVLVVEA